MTQTIAVGALAFFALLSTAIALPAQSVAPCGVPPVADPHAQPNIFSDQQELWLGDAMADMVETEYRPARDGSQNMHLQTIVDRLAATLPQTKIPFRVQLIDSSEINGFSLAGGHIYLTRKLVAAAQDDDELASVLGHEMGHIASHQFVFETTRDLKRLLGITSVGDKADITAKFQQLMDARMHDKHPLPSGDSDEKQDEADLIGVYVTAAAGYRPTASAELWNRVFYVGGKTGSRFSDFFGITKPNQKRLRGMLALASALPKGCGGTYTADAAAFAAWHKAVVENQAATVAVATDTAMQRVSLVPGLRMDVEHIRFSHDGRMLLAQDEGSIFVLTREPLKVLFRIDAQDALPAQFSPDSSRIVFSTPGMHTEEWSIADRRLIAAHEVFSKQDCLQTQITPDGRTLVCLSFADDHVTLDLALLDVATDAVVWQKKSFFEPTFGFFLSLIYFRGGDVSQSFMPSSISPDGNTLLVGPAGSKVAFDLRTRMPIKVGEPLEGSVTGAYAFVTNDTVLGVHTFDARSSGLYHFPDGKQMQKLAVPFNDMESVSNAGGNLLVLTHSVKNVDLTLVNLTTQKMVGLKTQSIDVWGDIVAAETVGGSIGLAKADGTALPNAPHVALPQSPLGTLHSVEISADGRYLSAATRHHGGVWDLTTGKQVFLMPAYTGGKWMPDGTMYADFPKVNDKERHITAITPGIQGGRDVSYAMDDHTRLRYGYFLEWKPVKKSAELIVHRITDNSVIWTKDFRDGEPYYTGSEGGTDGDLIFSYPMRGDMAKDVLKDHSELNDEAAAVKQKDYGRVIEVVDAATGTTEARAVLELPPNYAGVDGMDRVGDALYMRTKDNRTNVYSLKTGKKLREVFGYVVALDPKTERVCVLNRSDEALVYGPDGQELQHYRVGSRVRFAKFRNEGRSLVLLTADQQVRTMDVSKAAAVSVAAR